jgi:menaquinone-specific isochorismate synthase
MLDRPPIVSDLHQYLSRQIQESYHHLYARWGAELQGKIARIEIPTASIDPLAWLSVQSESILTYWADRDGDLTMAGVGSADAIWGDRPCNYRSILARMRSRLSPLADGVRYYGGTAFQPSAPPTGYWQAFGNYCFLVPRFELIKTPQRTLFAINFIVGATLDPLDLLTSMLAELDCLEFPSKYFPPAPLPLVIDRTDTPDFYQWQRNIDLALDRAAKLNIHKIVLARRSIFNFESPLHPQQLLRVLQPQNPHSYHFCFQLAPHLAFVGTSPERLYSRSDRAIATEAIAGTRQRGTSASLDLALAKDLQNSDKDVREHQFVVEAIAAILNRVCDRVSIDRSTPVLKLNKVQHLYCHFSGTLHPEISDGDLLSLLHPTPAVGGLPIAPALASIRSLETFDRGWYAAPVGWVGYDCSEFVVAIRSGAIDRSRLLLFAGAGIVPGSQAELEWAEIETKISHFTDLFNL